MRVLHINAGNLYGGVETVLATLARERACCPEMEPHFALCFDGRLSAELKEIGAPATRLGPVQTRFPWTILRARRKLKALLKELQPDAVVCHMSWTLAIFGPVVRKLRTQGSPIRNSSLVFWMHDRSDGKHWIERWARRTPPDLAICNSHFTSENLPRLFSDPTPPHAVVYCPVAPPEKLETKRNQKVFTREEFGAAPDSVVIIQVGRMEPYKGHAIHLQALAQLRDLPGWVCWMVGGAQRPHEQTHLESLRVQAKAAGIADRVRFLGEQRDIYRLLKAADIFCQPNLRGEPFGIVFLEALYAGLPVVTSAVGGASEIVTENCGALVPAGEVDALRDELDRLIQDPALRNELSSHAPARAHAISDPKRILPQLSRRIGRLLGKPAAKPTLHEALGTR